MACNKFNADGYVGCQNTSNVFWVSGQGNTAEAAREAALQKAQLRCVTVEGTPTDGFLPGYPNVYCSDPSQPPTPEWPFALQKATVLGETGDDFTFDTGTSQLVGVDNRLYCIKKLPDGVSYELHILNAGFESFALQTAIPFKAEVAEFAIAHNKDLFCIKKQNTGSGRTEIHVLSAASGYQSFRLQTATALGETGDDFSFDIAENNEDIFCIKHLPDGVSHQLHILDSFQGYGGFALQTAIPFTAEFAEFSVSSGRFLYCFKKRGTGTNSTEVHILSPGSGYQEFSRQIGTALHETGDNFELHLSPIQDLFAVKKSGTASHRTEVHVVKLP
jgi:hypothetical protein